MEKSKLVFNSSVTVTAFKAQQQAEKLRVVKNPETNKLFFICGGVTGAVGEITGLSAEDLLVSEVTSEGTGDTFFMLHKAGTLESVSEF